MTDKAFGLYMPLHLVTLIIIMIIISVTRCSAMYRPFYRSVVHTSLNVLFIFIPD